MDLAELSKRTGIHRRQLRYTIDNHLLADFDIQVVEDEVGRPRHFHNDVGFVVVAARRLLDVGMPHETIRFFLKQMVTIKFTGFELPALAEILTRNCSAFADLADGERVRLRVEGNPRIQSGWMPLAKTKQTEKKYLPLIVVTLDIGQIRDQVFSRA